ncbi:sensor histidine kinase [Kiloniella majae]|uniref:sensor histidine kinase n=1 Tax=Kiloniella majae TaxID=1938558 RepID=UPI000A278138|nr:ATP-binding protein [Kiloniella majae]
MSPPFHFKISTGLKDIVGRELITDDFVAIFELVKNSFDAVASRVDILFEEDEIFIIDDGKGMSPKEIEEKWLFLGFSAKRTDREEGEINALSDLTDDFRDRITRHRRGFAGNKGIGRFSCDRLGAKLDLYTRAVDQQNGKISLIQVNWANFEGNSEKEFESIPVESSEEDSVPLPPILTTKFRHGTVLRISGFRSSWPRSKILSLKASLAKLVNPFGIKNDLQVYLHSSKELEADKKVIASEEHQKIIEDFLGEHFSSETEAIDHIPTHYMNVVNGKVQNFVFKKISKHTTNVEVSLIEDGNKVRSRLYDRGELIVEFVQPNDFPGLKGTSVDVEVHYLNTAARQVFTRFMGQQSTQFGHVFLFNEGFRVFPIGEPRVDTFGLDTRKNQGRSRYLGTREVVGRIDVVGNGRPVFREVTSRDGGLIRTPEYEELEKFFIQYCIRLLERYVVNVNWIDKLDTSRLDLAGMETDVARARIIKVVSGLTKSPDVEIVSYSPRFLKILDEKSSDFSLAMKALEHVAERTKDTDLIEQLGVAQRRHAELIEAQERTKAEARAEREARKVAEEKAEAEAKAKRQAEQQANDERAGREHAEERAKAAEEKAADAEKKVSFFTALDTNDFQSLVNYLHHIGGYSDAITQQINLARIKISKGKFLETDRQIFVDRVELSNNKIKSIVNFSTKANFTLDGDETTADLSLFIPQYIENICSVFTGDGIDMTVENDASAFELTFRPIELFIVIDNLVHNSKKAEAKKIKFKLSSPKKNTILIGIEDNGIGLHQKFDDPKEIFKKGVTTTNGSGLGLNHARELVAELGGHLSAVVDDDRKITFKMEFAK